MCLPEYLKNLGYYTSWFFGSDANFDGQSTFLPKVGFDKIVDEFEINLNRCILCGICVDVCNFDAIVMTHEHEESGISRDGSRMDLSGLLEIGGRYQTQTGWQPSSKD